MYTFIQGLELHPFLREQLHVLVGMVKFLAWIQVDNTERCKEVFLLFRFL